MEEFQGHSVTQWLAALNDGDRQAAEAIWQRYMQKVLSLARWKMPPARRIADEEDVAISVFDMLFRGLAEGRFPRLHDRSELWPLLVTLTQQKVIDQHRREARKKRGSGRVRGDSVFSNGHSNVLAMTFDDLASEDPTPDFLAAMQEEFENLLNLLRDDVLRQIATARLASYSVEEIAEQLGVSRRTVQRKMNLIQQKWSRAVRV